MELPEFVICKKLSVKNHCVYIDKIDLISILDELMYLPKDELIALNIFPSALINYKGKGDES